MVAMDQRESLRAMLGGAGDEELVAFKADVAAVLAPEASGFLVDPQYGSRILAGDGKAGLIVAADTLVGTESEVVADARFDDALDLSGFARAGVAAAKLLVVWRDDGRKAERVADAARFVEACREAGLVSIVEGVVRPITSPTREAELVECARELGAVGPTLYKAEVPYFGRGPAGRITDAAAEVSVAVGRPWVVLSSHVDRADFAGAVEACCRGGASGMLAGRALWTNALSSADRRATLAAESVPYLRELSAVVAATARPWTAVA